MMQRIRLIHWGAAGIEEQAAAVRAAGYTVEIISMAGGVGLPSLRANPPDAIVIDFSTHPSCGEELAQMLRSREETATVPLFLIVNDPAHGAAPNSRLPDVTWSSWAHLTEDLRRVLRPSFIGRPLALKLGIQPGFLVGLIDAPADFEKMLGELPQDVKVRRGAIPLADMTLWFVVSQRELEARIRSMLPLANRDNLWIIWPKRSFRSDLTQSIVRRICTAAGLLDIRIGLLDDDWFGIRFRRRRGDYMKR